MTRLLPIQDLYAIPVPNDSCDHAIVHIYAGEDILYWYQKGKPKEEHYGAINIDDPDYTVLFTSQDVTLSQLSDFVSTYDSRPMTSEVFNTILRTNGLTPDIINYVILKKRP